MSAKTATGAAPRPAERSAGVFHGVRRERREIHGQAVLVAGHIEPPAPGIESDRIGIRPQMMKHDVGAGEGRMAAQIDLGQRREPAQGVGAVGGHEERGLRQVVLVRDGLQRGIVEPGIQRADGSGIAAEHRIGERIDLEYLQPHATVY